MSLETLEIIGIGGKLDLLSDQLRDYVRLEIEKFRKHELGRVKLVYSKENEEIDSPYYATKNSVGFDVSPKDDGVVSAGKTSLVPTGLRFQIPEGFLISVRPRSGLSLNSEIWIRNSPGTIDTDYTGELQLIIYNAGSEDFYYKKGDRLAQCLIEKCWKADFIESDFEDAPTRGVKGFGSTGK